MEINEELEAMDDKMKELGKKNLTERDKLAVQSAEFLWDYCAKISSKQEYCKDCVFADYYDPDAACPIQEALNEFEGTELFGEKI